MGRLPDEYFSDYEAYTEDEIAEITSKGILLKNGMFIFFGLRRKFQRNKSSKQWKMCR